MKNETVNYKSLELLQGLLSPEIKIDSLEVKGKWLTATLTKKRVGDFFDSYHMTLSVKN